MPKVTVLPHPGICPNGAEFEVPEGANLAKALVANGVNIDHACEVLLRLHDLSLLHRQRL